MTFVMTRSAAADMRSEPTAHGAKWWKRRPIAAPALKVATRRCEVSELRWQPGQARVGRLFGNRSPISRSVDRTAAVASGEVSDHDRPREALGGRAADSVATLLPRCFPGCYPRAAMSQNATPVETAKQHSEFKVGCPPAGSNRQPSD
jgi:hypothetical protein